MEDDKDIELGGRTFAVPADRSIANDLYLEGETRRAGLDDLRMEKGESADQFAKRVTDQAIASGRIFPILGGLVLPAELDPSDWTEAIAAETGKHLSRCKGAEDKAAIRAMTAQVLSRFFLIGLASATTSPTSSTAGSHESGPGSQSLEPFADDRLAAH